MENEKIKKINWLYFGGYIILPILVIVLGIALTVWNVFPAGGLGTILFAIFLFGPVVFWSIGGSMIFKKQNKKMEQGIKKQAKDKESKKDIQKEINKLKKERKEIGKKDTYIRDVKKEMSMVRWPSAKEVIKYSIASLVFVAFFALFFYGIDAIFALVKDLIS